MDADASPPRSARMRGDGYVHGPIDRPQQLPERRRRPMAQHRSLPTGEHRRGPCSVAARSQMPHCVDATMQTMQPSRPRPLRDRRPAQSKRDELGGGYDPMLRRSNASNLQIDRGEFVNHWFAKSPRPLDSPPFGRSSQRFSRV